MQHIAKNYEYWNKTGSTWCVGDWLVVWLLLESVEQGHIVPGVALAVCADTALSSTASWASRTNDLIHPRPLTPLHPMA